MTGVQTCALPIYGLTYKCKKCTTKHYLNNKEKISEYNKKYYLNNQEKVLKNLKKYRKTPEYKKVQTKYERDKYNTNPNFKIVKNIRRRILHAIKDNHKSNRTIKLLGCTIEKLKQHLELQLTKGMNWNNYGKWHIDHIKPCSSFNLSQSEEQEKCFHYTNLQPLWAKDNLKKSDKLTFNIY